LDRYLLRQPEQIKLAVYRLHLMERLHEIGPAGADYSKATTADLERLLARWRRRREDRSREDWAR